MAKKITSVGILIAGAFLISTSSADPAQSRSHPKAPKTLLEILDPEDRNCVVQGGGLNQAVQVQPIQLARDKSRQLLVRGSGLCLCGAQNCLFWIYRKTGNGYELLLKGDGSRKVKAGTQSAKGLRDVVSESHASANETIVRTYRFDGKQYELHRCTSRAYYDDNGNYTKKPVYRPC